MESQNPFLPGQKIMSDPLASSPTHVADPSPLSTRDLNRHRPGPELSKADDRSGKANHSGKGATLAIPSPCTNVRLPSELIREAEGYVKRARDLLREAGAIRAYRSVVRCAKSL